MHAVHGRVLPNFSFSFPNSSWHSAMNGMRNLNACHPWQSAAQFFFFLLKLFMALCHEWHADKLNACCPWQSAAQFFFFLPKLFMALCHEQHAQSKCMLSMAECCPIFLFFQTSLGIYTKHYRKGHLYKQNLAFIQ